MLKWRQYSIQTMRGEVLDEDEPIDGTISNVEDVTVPSCPDPSFQHSTAPQARAGSTDEQEVESDVTIPEVLAPLQIRSRRLSLTLTLMTPQIR